MQDDRPVIADITFDAQDRVLRVRDPQGRVIGLAARNELDEVTLIPRTNGRGWMLIFLLDDPAAVPSLGGVG